MAIYSDQDLMFFIPPFGKDRIRIGALKKIPESTAVMPQYCITSCQGEVSAVPLSSQSSHQPALGQTYWVIQKLPQIYTENYATFPIQIRKITVQICGNFWVTQ
mgnify:CR=1 FL=1